MGPTDPGIPVVGALRRAPVGTGPTLHDTAALVGGHVWTERRLFEVLGAAVGVLSDPAAKVLVDRHGAHAAWRAGQWWDRLPVLAVVDRESLVVAPSPGIAAAYGLIAESRGEVAVLAGIYRVALPRLGAAYRAHARRTGPAADGSVGRTLHHAGIDLEGDRAEGEPYVHSLLVDAGAVDAAAAAVAGLERLLVER